MRKVGSCVPLCSSERSELRGELLIDVAERLRDLAGDLDEGCGSPSSANFTDNLGAISVLSLT
jgi:hypothetical protein